MNLARRRRYFNNRHGGSIRLVNVVRAAVMHMYHLVSSRAVSCLVSSCLVSSCLVAVGLVLASSRLVSGLVSFCNSSSGNGAAIVAATIMIIAVIILIAMKITIITAIERLGARSDALP